MAKVRMPSLAKIEIFLGVAIPLVGLVFILDLPLYLTGTSLFNQQYLALFWALVTALIFLTKPLASGGQAGRWYDLLLAALAVFVGLYVAILYPQLLYTLGVVTPFQAVLGFLAVGLVLESTRRLVGWPIVIIVLFFILYARFGYLLPGILYTKGLTWPRLLSQLYLGADFLFGTPLRIAALVVFAFILFGQLLFQTGGGDFLINLAQALMGRYRGGPAKVAVLASSLFGTLSGSAVANVASTGVITIPLMKRTGYQPVFAGAVEAVSSTGGALMPPVMGAAAFIMAEFLSVPYAVVALPALVPALLYYLGEYLQIDLRAARQGLKGLPREELPSFRETLRQGWIFLVPLAVLIYALFFLFLRAEVAALYACAALVILTLLKKDTRRHWSWTTIVNILRSTTTGVLEITAICAAAGLVVGLVSYTGLGLSLSRLLTEVAGGNLLLLAILTAIASTVLGMGMPATASYILLAVLAAPALLTLGVEPVLAHLFVFYFGVFSFLTPPVCLAAYAAASIAGASPMAVAFQAVKLAIAGYVVPFFFLYNPALALIGAAPDVILAVFDAVVAVTLLAFGLEGWAAGRLRWWERVLLVVAAIAMFVPNWPSRLVGLAIAVPLLVVQFRARGSKVTVEVRSQS